MNLPSLGPMLDTHILAALSPSRALCAERCKPSVGSCVRPRIMGYRVFVARGLASWDRPALPCCHSFHCFLLLFVLSEPLARSYVRAVPCQPWLIFSASPRPAYPSPSIAKLHPLSNCLQSNARNYFQAWKTRPLRSTRNVSTITPGQGSEAIPWFAPAQAHPSPPRPPPPLPPPPPTPHLHA